MRKIVNVFVFLCFGVLISCGDTEEKSSPLVDTHFKSQGHNKKRVEFAPDPTTRPNIPELPDPSHSDSSELPAFCFNLQPNNLQPNPGAWQRQDFRSVRQIPRHIPIKTPVVLRKDALNGKIHPRLSIDKKMTYYVRNRIFSPNSIKSTGEIGLLVRFEKQVALFEGRKIIEKYGANYEGAIKVLNVILVSIPEENLENFEEISKEEKVRWIDTWPASLSPINNRVRSTSGVDRMRLIYPDYTGWGVITGIYDSTPVCSHYDFGCQSDAEICRLTVGVGEKWPENCGSHATHVAGIIGGSGLMSEDWGMRTGRDIAPFQFQGIAPDVRIISYALGGCERIGCLYNDPGDIEQDFENFILTYDVDNTSMSLGANIKRNWEPCEWLGDTTLTSILMDTITGGWAFGRELIHNQSAGNENSSDYNFRCHEGYRTLTTPAAGMKNSNVICAVDDYGAPTDFTSWAPADDGAIRILGGILGKDVWSTVGRKNYDDKSGTSMSSPGMAGIEDLMIQAFYTKYGRRPLPALVKAILANSMEETVGTPYGPDFQCGFGYMSELSTLEAIETIHQERFIEDVVSHGEEITYLMVVLEDTPEVRVTIAWRDEPGSIERQELGLPQLVQDIDMSMENPFGTIRYPLVPDPEYPDNEAVEREDHLNNIEQIVIQEPRVRCYLLKVKGYNLPAGPQRFAIAYKGIYKWPLILNVKDQLNPLGISIDKLNSPVGKVYLPLEDDRP